MVHSEEIEEGAKYMALQSRQFVVDDTGRKTAVLLPIKEYEHLIEDLHDLAIAAERKDEERISLAEMKKRLQRDGRL
jgi:PHD/YefM family antitoxin component YafN of YafNO toxin-antitoxin module